MEGRLPDLVKFVELGLQKDFEEAKQKFQAGLAHVLQAATMSSQISQTLQGELEKKFQDHHRSILEEIAKTMKFSGKKFLEKWRMFWAIFRKILRREWVAWKHF